MAKVKNCNQIVRLIQEQNLNFKQVITLPNTFEPTQFKIASKPQYLLKRYNLTAQQPIIFSVTRYWLEALRLTYNAPIPPGLDRTEAIATTLQTWAANFYYQPEDLLPGSRGEENYHNPIRSYISHSFWEIAEKLGGQSFSRDFVMRLGNNGFTLIASHQCLVW